MPKPVVRPLKNAPGAPGAPPRWASGSKNAGGTSRSDTSLVWFTLAGGVLTEVYYPRIDSPCTRDLRFLVTGPSGFYSDEQQDVEHRVAWFAEGVPGFEVTSTCSKGRYRISKTILVDDRLSALLVGVRFEALTGEPRDYRLFVNLNPHVAGRGGENTAWIGEFKGRTVLFASRGDLALALAPSTEFSTASAGFLGRSDGIEDLKKGGRLLETHQLAEGGNVVLVGELPIADSQEFTLALGFGIGADDAAHHAVGSLLHDFHEEKATYSRRWLDWQKTLLPLDSDRDVDRDLYRASTAIFMSHANKAVPGAVASLAIPWGDHRGDDDLMQGAYHLVWSRDLVQHGGGLLAAGANSEALQLLKYLRATQESDGHWPQNMWISGEAFWDGIQTDQAAQPILLVDLASREGALSADDQRAFWPMVRNVIGFVAKNGASSEQDRWEERTGYNPFTLAATIAALLAASRWADEEGEDELAKYLYETAMSWDACIEGWTYVRDTVLSRRLGIDGYYARIFAPDQIEPASPGQGAVRLIGNPDGGDGVPAAEVVSADALALVRFGLRAPDDPRIQNTVKAIDATLKIETSRGPIWHRYVGDRFGERDDGSPFETESKGRGRAWPLLIGERAHYELARGDFAEAIRLAKAMADYAYETGLIPEQVWDADDLPEHGLYRGRPTGSASPLLWAHSEYVKLRRSLRDGRIFDQPQETSVGRQAVEADVNAIWRVDHPCRSIPSGVGLRIEATEGVEIRLQVDGIILRTAWKEVLGVRFANLSPAELSAGKVIRFDVTRPGTDGFPRQEEHRLVVKAGDSA